LMWIIFFVAAFIALFTWLSSRFHFVWYDAIVLNDSKIKGPFKKYKKEGNSLFQFYMLTYVVWLAVIAGLGTWGYKIVTSQKEVGPHLLQLASPILLFILFALASCLVYFVTRHFIVPIMVIENCRIKDAFRRMARIYEERTREIWLFLLVFLGLSIVGAIAMTLVTLSILVTVFLIALLVFGLFYFLIAFLLKAKFVFWVLVVVGGVPLGVAGLLALLMTGLPVAIFFRNFSLYFLTSLDCGINPLVIPEEEAQTETEE